MSSLEKNQNFIKNQVRPTKRFSTAPTLYVSIDGVKTALGSDKNIYIEEDGEYKRISTITYGYNAQWFNADMEFLDKKVDQAFKRMNALDFLKITEVVNSEQDFAATINNLNPNSSLIINTDSFSQDNKTYSRGDIVFKKNDFTIEQIKAERGGIYFPSKIEQINQSNNNYMFTYSFTPVQPTLEDEPTSGKANYIEKNSENNTWDASAALSYKKIGFSGIQSNDAVPLYNLAFTSNADQSFNTKFITKNNEQIPVRPNIKMYIKTNNEYYEEIQCEYSCNYTDNDKWDISNIPSIVTYWTVK